MNILSFETELKKVVKPLVHEIEAARKELTAAHGMAVSVAKSLKSKNPERAIAIEEKLSTGIGDIETALKLQFAERCKAVLSSEAVSNYMSARQANLNLLTAKIAEVESELSEMVTSFKKDEIEPEAKLQKASKATKSLKDMFSLTEEIARLEDAKADLESIDELEKDIETIVTMAGIPATKGKKYDKKMGIAAMKGNI